ncbi:MAG TPA: protein kinase [Gemmataceae bacterium]|nr:protein kinase [Gemmataceae bacterium]
MATAPALSAPNLLKVLRDNRLVDPSRLDPVLKSLPPEAADAPDPKAVADALVANRLLTKFQTSLLIQGKSKTLTIAGKYRLIDRLGAGGMGLVYLCEHLKMKRPVAVKVLPHKNAAEPGQLDRFLREAQAAAALKHPNIVQAYDLDQDAGVHYLVMEFVDGADLDRLVSKIGALDPNRAAYYVAQAALGLQHAAERGMVHRDIKPSNLLVDREGIVKVLDLGLARLSGRAGLTERFDANAVIGTADYIAPEQALNSSEVDVRADIYSLGCTFYFLLAGHAPFKDANVTQKLLMHQMRDAPSILQVRTDVHPRMAAIVARMMAKDPAQRYQQPIEVAEDLAPWTDPPPPPPTEDEIPSRGLGTGAVSGSSLTGHAPGSTALPKGGTQRVGMTARRVAGHPEPETSWKIKGLILGGVGLVGVLLIGLIAWRPWASPAPEDDTATAESKATPAKTITPAPPAPPPRPGKGLSFVILDVPAHRTPAVVNGELRETPTDVIYFFGANLTKATAGDPNLSAVFRRDAVGALLPYAVGNTGAPHPNTLVGVDAAGGLRAIPLEEYETGARPVGPEQSLLLRGANTLRPGLTQLNGLVADLSDVTAGQGGSVLKVNAGVVLLAGAPPADRDSILGAGAEPLTIDFAGRTGYLTVASDQDFIKTAKGVTREHHIRAKLTGFGDNPLVLSGMWGNVAGLRHLDNDFPRLVIQGLSMAQGAASDKVFRVTFTEDRQLGVPQGPITLIDASLSYQGDTSPEIDRPLTLVSGKVGRLAAIEKTKGARITLRWTGRISGGGKLLKAGNAPVVLTNGSNDYYGGTEVLSGHLVLQAEDGSPAGSGGVFVGGGGTLAGTGRVPSGVTVRPGGTLQPGDGGKPLRVGGLTFQRGKDSATASFVARPSAAGHKLVLYDGTQALDLGGATLKVTPAAGFQATADTVVALIVNQRAPAVRGTFQNLEGGARLVTTDGKWTVRVSYQGDAKAGVPAGGKDVVLYDWNPVRK